MGFLRRAKLPGGIAQVNLWFSYAEIDFPFLDVFKMVDRVWEAPSATEDYLLLLSDTGYPSRMPSGASLYRTYTSGYLVSSDPWVLTWTGSATVGIQFTGGGTVTPTATTNRIEYDVALGSGTVGDRLSMQVQITAITTAPSNIRIFRKSQELLLNGGEKWNPDFLTKYTGWGRIRFMDWLATNLNPLVKWADRTTTAMMSWSGQNMNMPVYCGTPTRTGNAYSCPNAIRANPSSWTHGQMLQCTLPSGPAFFTVSNWVATSGAVSTITTSGAHGLSTNDVICFSADSWSNADSSLEGAANINNSTWGKFYTVTVTNSTTFTIPVDSRTWRAYTTGGAGCKQITVAAGLLSAMRVLGQKLGGLSSAAISNDITNFGGASTFVYDSDASALIYKGQALYSCSGVPIELIVDLCNRLSLPPWLCIPVGADDDFITQMATYVRDNRTYPGKTCWELSNEIWNSAFTQTLHAFKKGNLAWALLGSDAYNTWYGKRFYEAMGLIGTVFSGQMSLVDRVISVFTGGYTGTSQTLPRFEAPSASLGAFPISRADSIAIAPYYEPDRTLLPNTQYVDGYRVGGASKTAALAWLDGLFRDDGGSSSYTVKNLHDTIFPAWKTFANTYSVKLTQYEGGYGPVGAYYTLTGSNPFSGGITLTSTDVDNFINGYHDTQLYADTLTTNLNNFIAAGGEYPSQYVLVGTLDHTAGDWGMIHPNLYGTSSPAYTALRAVNGI